jgi:hypothetical protein
MTININLKPNEYNRVLTGYLFPTLEGNVLYTGLHIKDLKLLVDEIALIKPSEYHVGYEVYSSSPISEGEFADYKEDIVKEFGELSFIMDINDHLGYQPIVRDAVSACLFGSMAFFTKSPILFYFAYLDLRRLATNIQEKFLGYKQRAEISEKIAVNMEIRKGSDPTLKNKLDNLTSYFNTLEGNEETIYHKMMTKSKELGFEEAEEFYKELYEKATGYKLTWWQRWKKKLHKLANHFYDTYDIKPHTILKRKIIGKSIKVREIPVYALPTKEGYEIYVEQTPDMYHLAKRDDIRFKLKIRAPEKLSEIEINEIKENLPQYFLDTTYQPLKLEQLMEKTMYEKDTFQRIIGDGLGLHFLIKGLKHDVPTSAAIGAYLIINTEIFGRWQNRKLLPHAKEKLEGIDKLNEKLTENIDVVVHEGLKEIKEAIEQSDNVKDGYTDAYNIASQKLKNYAEIYHQKALHHQRTFKEPKKPAFIISSGGQKDE